MTNKHAEYTLTLEHLWQFSLQFYGVREVKEACLSLQNNYHGNVNLLLLLRWLDEQQLIFQEKDWHLVQSCLGRSETLLHSFRDLRRHLKSQVNDALYRESLQFELQLEKQQQADLVDCINSLTLIKNDGAPLTLRYCRQLGGEHLQQAFAIPVPNIHPPKHS
ncbi:TIGR02444 family protein [Vibrio parahaemolyticus]|uniref:TIGR02444 family protein n=1 Tax=Vibrio parahaemolyticus TaxID=670 RepID=UPI001120BFF6|nr:TIGR02444 family protein [Vibrio parahaemolyticus]EGR2184906.1 TIGR02444 family protein [Vibrio parahaemolyticus]MDF4745759.1 TIGR02444 family protein [Vibrio parahaemolyticus]TOI46182.1 TIGR02444 family protein [Vibrio parahaemolyticus]TOK68298.1 TIGR02444 family protein [Vibrio parahaemolyticus]HCG5954078.1 TIGR02444 family protein [Vibrio parahaemolyticus]